MRVKRVALRDFRNYEAAEVELAAGLTVVVGSNGAGKTNLLEALYVGLTARSCRTSNERELVRIGAPLAVAIRPSSCSVRAGTLASRSPSRAWSRVVSFTLSR